MPAYVAQRAINLAKGISNPKVLILGVAYKPGVGDVRETPALDLKKALEECGAEVVWHDPLVNRWENTTPVGLDVDYDVAILATNHPGMELSLLKNDLKPLLDCTNSKISGKKVFLL
jgi:UDP-N-acetyl-D-glucosamine dehydrogenase